MAGKSIIQRISLEGGAAIKAQLEAIGAAGTKAFTDLQAAVQSNRSFGNVAAAFDGVKAKAEQVAAAGRKLGTDFDALGGSLRNTAKSVGVVSLAVGGAVAGFVLFVTAGGKTVDQLEKLSAELGITTKEFENLRDAAEQSGVKEEELTRAFRAIRKEQVAAEKVTGDFAKKRRELTREFGEGKKDVDAYFESTIKLNREERETENGFTNLGVQALDANGKVRGLSDVVNDVADELKAITDPTERSARAFDLLGTRSAKTLAFFAQGSEGIAKMKTEAERTAPALTKLQKDALGLADDAFDKLARSATSATNALRATISPRLADIFNAITEAIVRNRGAFLDYASTVISKVKPIVDDIIALIDGRDKDVKNSFIIKARDAMVEFGVQTEKAVTGIIIPALKGLIAVLDIVAKGINLIFGSNFSGGQIAIALVITRVLGLFGLLSGAVSVVVSGLGLLSAALGGPILIAIAAVGFAIGFGLVTALKNVDWAGFARRAQQAWDDLTSGVRIMWRLVKAFFTDGVTGVINEFNKLSPEGQIQAKSMIDGMLKVIFPFPSLVAAVFGRVADAIKGAFDDAINWAREKWNGFWDWLGRKIDGAIDKFRQLIGLQSGNKLGVDAGLNDIGGKARGGYVNGPGSGTSDSILSWLSNGEFVIRADAVRKWGTGFLSQINAGMNPFRGGGFSGGGLVNALAPFAPRFAEGGLASIGSGSSLRSVNINLDGMSFGASMSEDVLGRLNAASIKRRARSAGRKPSFVGV